MNTPFYEKADQARSAEILGKRKAAGKLWLQASELAKKTDNAAWAEARADFCFNSRFAPAPVLECVA